MQLKRKMFWSLLAEFSVKCSLNEVSRSPRKGEDWKLKNLFAANVATDEWRTPECHKPKNCVPLRPNLYVNPRCSCCCYKPISIQLASGSHLQWIKAMIHSPRPHGSKATRPFWYWGRRFPHADDIIWSTHLLKDAWTSSPLIAG